MNKIESAIFNSAINYISNYITNEKTYVLEPITCMVRLAMLSFKPDGTKIGIFDNSIYIQEPSVFQGPMRWISGDNRNDIHFLLDPINKALERYNIQHNESVKNIYKFAIKGLLKLKKSYSSNNHNSSLTAHSIELYIKTIHSYLDGKCISNENEDDDKTYNSLFHLWSEEQIDIINGLFIECNKNQSEAESYLDAIDNILNSKVKATKEILVKNMNNI